ncbi:MAG: metal-dependent hydrolase [Ardenticatenaceae bacterium]|nr:metal-dependent hydrolase [Ardenticatenaceae bacterium]
MMGESHMIFGAAATATGLVTLGYTPNNVGVGHFALAVGLGALVALLPDIDSPNTKVRQIFGVGSRQASRRLKRWYRTDIFTNLLNLIRYAISRVLDLLAWLLPHRGPTHWLIVAATLTYAFYWFSRQYGWPLLWWRAFAIGYGSHLFADGLTSSGVKLFAPFYKKSVGLPIRFLRVRTGSWEEGTALAMLLLACMGWLVWWV